MQGDTDTADGGDADAGGSEDEEEEVNPQSGTNDSQPSDSSTPPPTPVAPAGPRSTPVQTAKCLKTNYLKALSGHGSECSAASALMAKIAEPSSYQKSLESEHAGLHKAEIEDATDIRA